MKIPGFELLLRSFPRPGDDLGFHGTWRERAVEHGYLPVYSDWVQGFAINADGQAFYSEDDSWADAKKLTNPRYQHIVLAQAAAVFPELSNRRPVRNAGDPDCPSCGGAGGAADHPEIICECGNLGWIPRGSSLEPSL